MLLPFVLIMKEPDLGSALVLVPAGLVMMYVAGTPQQYLLRLRWCGRGSGGSVPGGCAFRPPHWQVKLEDYQRRRLLVYFGKDYAPNRARPKADQERYRKQQFDDSHNVRQALISVGSGGLTGKGWRQGTQNALGYLPRAVAHNDFIFSVIAEEKGFHRERGCAHALRGGSVHGDRIAGQARDRLGKIAGGGGRRAPLQPRLHQYRHEHSIDACNGRATAAAILRRILSAQLVDRDGHLQNVYIYRKAY